MSGHRTVLDTIAKATRARVAKAKTVEPEGALRARLDDAPAPRPFRELFVKNGLNVIAEIKRASPSEGQLAGDLDPASIAKGYADNGAAAISVLTEPEFFHGDLKDLEKVRDAVSSPLLNKDFLLDEYQILQARLAGADAVLLIVALLGARKLADMMGGARLLGLDTLVEVHDEEEMKIALGAGAGLVGVNNRNLKTMEVDLATSRALARYSDKAALISESGLKGRKDLEELAMLGYRGFLIGTHFIKSGRPGAALAEILVGEASP